MKAHKWKKIKELCEPNLQQLNTIKVWECERCKLIVRMWHGGKPSAINGINCDEELIKHIMDS